ncbi:MAG: hypothetical protein N2037_06020 [Acidimicrobiales bacterium]|nr:hypothetical protein [Acidimicrobiales bacterium]
MPNLDPVEELPLAYLVALRLEQLAVPDEQAAWVLGLTPEALGPLREVARRRLRDLGFEDEEDEDVGGSKQ